MMKTVILGSGRGSNALAILEAEKAGSLGKAQVVGILTDTPEAGILQHAKSFGKPARQIDPGGYKTRLSDKAEAEYVEQIDAWGANLVVLAGFMRVLKKTMLKAFTGRMINLHPSLLPRYPGLNAIERALENGDRETGCTVHWVTAEVDGGQIIAQKRVRIEETDTLESLEKKVHQAEHELLPRVIAEISRELA